MFAVRIAVVLMLVVAACSTDAEPDSNPTTTATPVTTTTNPTTASTEPPLELCDPPTFLPTFLPERVIGQQPDPSAIPLDEFTLQPGTIVTGWTDETGSPVVVMVRGGLPPRRWIETPETIEVHGVEAALGDLGEGVWATAWFEGPDRCDEYYLVFYPPTGPEEARAVVESLTG